MILRAVFAALAQLGDPRFRRVLLLGLALTIGLLLGIGTLFIWGVQWLIPDTLSLPWIGDITWLDSLGTVAGGLLMLVLSVFLMVPVASAFTGFFLEDVAEAVESRHYPGLPPARRQSLADQLRESAGFLLLLIGVNMVALLVYLLLAPAAPLIFWSVNGFLLGREYFQMVALRRMPRAEAVALRRRHAGTIFLAGALMAVPLSLPLVNLLVPIVGAASFTHLYHALTGRSETLAAPER